MGKARSGARGRARVQTRKNGWRNFRSPRAERSVRHTQSWDMLAAPLGHRRTSILGGERAPLAVAHLPRPRRRDGHDGAPRVDLSAVCPLQWVRHVTDLPEGRLSRRSLRVPARSLSRCGNGRQCCPPQPPCHAEPRLGQVAAAPRRTRSRVVAQSVDAAGGCADLDGASRLRGLRTGGPGFVNFVDPRVLGLPSSCRAARCNRCGRRHWLEAALLAGDARSDAVRGHRPAGRARRRDACPRAAAPRRSSAPVGVACNALAGGADLFGL